MYDNQNISNKIKSWLIILLWIGIIPATYRGYGNQFVLTYLGISMFLLLFIEKGQITINFTASFWKIFIGYYFLISIINIPNGYTDPKEIMNLVIKYIFIPVIIWLCMSNDYTQNKKTLVYIRNLLVFSAIYGLIEEVLKYNYLIKFILINDYTNEINTINNVGYQVTSIFMHYNYYGIALILCWILLCTIPFKLKIYNYLFRILIIEQLIICQSRISWIAMLFIVIVQFLEKNKAKVSRNIIVSLAAIALIVIFLPKLLNIITNSIFGKRFANIFQYGMLNGSVGQRLGTLENWPTYFQNNIINGVFGTGYQSIGNAFLNKYSYFSGYSTADNQLTIYLVETGIIGTTIAIFAMGNLLVKKIGKNSNLNLAFRLLILLIIIESTTLDVISNNIILILFYVLSITFLKESELFEIKKEKHEN